MWKISVVMLVTVALAAMLIYEPYEVSRDRPALAAKTAAKAVVAPVLAPVEAASAGNAQPSIRPQDIESVVLKVLADRAPKEKEEPKAAVAQQPLPATISFQDWPASQNTGQAPVIQPVLRRREDAAATQTEAVLPEKATKTVSLRPGPGANGLQERPALQSAAQPSAIVQSGSGRREDVPPSRLDAAVTIDGSCIGGEVVGLDPNGDNFLSVRSGPGGQPFREIDRLFSADAVHVCGRKAPWLAVVYSAGRKANDGCDMSPKGMRHTYDGSCQYGWVHSRYIRVKTIEIAGRR